MTVEQFCSPVAAEVIVDAVPYPGSFNMAMDAALLHLALERQQSVVRVYRWSEPTVTLGYFQKSESGFPDVPALSTVRRLSGGGAILHHHELTYSCALPATHPVREDPSALYRIVHQALIDLFARCGASCRLRSDRRDGTGAAGAVEPWLCFLREDPNDIVDERGQKVVGSAQRRRRGAILQHGSILLRRSEFAPQVAGLTDVCPEFDLARLEQDLPDTIAGAVATTWQRRDYLPIERDLAGRLPVESDRREAPRVSGR